MATVQLTVHLDSQPWVLRQEQSVRGEKSMATLHVKPIPSQAKKGMDQAIERAGNDPRSPGIYRLRIIS